MKINIGGADKILRIVLGISIIVIGFVFKSWWGVIGVVPLLTAFLGTCPLYLPFGISTCKPETKPGK